MTRRKTDPIIAGRIRQLLDMNWSYYKTIIDTKYKGFKAFD
jgi:hypothetical protein